MKSHTQLKDPMTMAMTQCYQGRPPLAHSMMTSRNSITMIWKKQMKNHMIKNSLLEVIPSKIFFSSWIFLALTMLNTWRYTNTLNTLVMCLEGPKLSYFYSYNDELSQSSHLPGYKKGEVAALSNLHFGSGSG